MKQLEPEVCCHLSMLSLGCRRFVAALSPVCRRMSLAREVIAFFDLILFLIPFYYFPFGSRSPRAQATLGDISATFQRQAGDNAATKTTLGIGELNRLATARKAAAVAVSPIGSGPEKGVSDVVRE